MLFGWLANLDDRTLVLINSAYTHPLLDHWAIILSGPHWWWAIAALGIAVSLRRKLGQRTWIKFFLTLLITIGVADAFAAQLLKPHFGRVRPCWHTEEQPESRSVVGCGGRFSFPSNHAVNSATIAAVLLSVGASAAGATAAVIALLVGWSRIYLGVHFPGDVIGGLVIGGIIGFAVMRLPIFRRSTL